MTSFDLVKTTVLSSIFVIIAVRGTTGGGGGDSSPLLAAPGANNNNNNIIATPAMPECEPYYIAGVYTAVCMRRRLVHVPRNLMTSIQVMDASNNEMIALRDGEFRTYPWLKEIYLQENKIRHIGRNAFANLTRLQTLVLTANDLSQLDGDVFRPISNLRVLRLSNNPLRVLRRETFRYLRHLVEFRVDSCLLTKIEPGTLRPFIGTLEVLSVAYNQLTIFTADLASQYTPQNHLSSVALKEAHLYGNPWHCNCQMRLLRLLLNESPDITFNFGSDLKAPTCYSPPNLAGLMWSRIPADRFGCEPVVTGANMPPMPQVGQNITLQCSFAADPSPTFRWYKDGIPVSDVESSTETTLAAIVSTAFRGKVRQKDRKLAAHNFTSRLELIEIITEFSGIYECIAENTAGSSKSKFQLRIRGADGRYELPGSASNSGNSNNNEAELNAGLLTSLVAHQAARSPTTRLVIVAGVVGTVLIIFLLTVTAVYFCFCRRHRNEKDNNSAVAILRKIEAKRLALTANHDTTLSLRKNILSNSSSIHSHLRHSQLHMDGEDVVKLTEVYPSHLAATSPSSEESGVNSNKRESSNSTVVTNDRSSNNSSKSSPDNSTANGHLHHHHHHRVGVLGVEHLMHNSDEMDEEAMAVVTPLCYCVNNSNKSEDNKPLDNNDNAEICDDGGNNSNNNNDNNNFSSNCDSGNNSGGDVDESSLQNQQELAMVQSAAFKTYSEYLSLTLPKMIHSPRYNANRSNSGTGFNVDHRNNNGLLQATLVRQLPILSAYGYVEQIGADQQQQHPPKVSMNDLSDLDLSDIDSASQTGSGMTHEHARLAIVYHHPQQQQPISGRRQQRYAGDLHHSVFLPAPMTFSSSSSSGNNNNNKPFLPPQQHSLILNNNNNNNNNNNGNLVHFLDEPAPKMAISTTSSADTSV